jgi:hypothetical protein
VHERIVERVVHGQVESVDKVENPFHFPPGNAAAFIKTQESARTFIKLDIVKCRRRFRPAYRPLRLRDQIAFVQPVPCFNSDLDDDNPGENREEDGRRNSTERARRGGRIVGAIA